MNLRNEAVDQQDFREFREKWQAEKKEGYNKEDKKIAIEVFCVVAEKKKQS